MGRVCRKGWRGGSAECNGAESMADAELIADKENCDIQPTETVASFMESKRDGWPLKVVSNCGCYKRITFFSMTELVEGPTE